MLRPKSLIAMFLLACTLPCLGQLETRGTTSTLIYPAAMVTGDFNNDGKPDLAVASVYNNNGVTILLGRGNGTFGIGSEFTVWAGGGTYSITAADFNHDGNVDLAVVQYLNATISVLFGNGDGTFQAPVNYATPVGPTFLAAGDFNGDGAADLVVLDHYATCECLSVFLNNGDGTFGAPIDTPIPLPYGEVMGVGDFNRDGKLDVVTAGVNGSSSTMQVFLGNGDGTFIAAAFYDLGSYVASAFAVADLRGVGILDVVMLAGGAVVFLGNGDGTFQPMVPYHAAVSTGGVAVADFNGDGKPDIVVSDDDPAQHLSGVTVFLGRGDGTFKKAYFYSIGDQSVDVAVADFNGDKKPDVAVADALNSYVTSMLNTGVVSFSPSTPLNFGGVKVGTTSTPLTVKLTNTGKSALTISSMKTGQFAMTSTCGSSIPAGANCSISVTFSPTSGGPKSGTVALHDSASSKPQVIALSGTGN